MHAFKLRVYRVKLLHNMDTKMHDAITNKFVVTLTPFLFLS